MTKLLRRLSVDEALAALAGVRNILSIEEAADALGISTSTLRRRIQDGRLRAFKTTPGPGGRLRILKRDLALLLARMGS